MVTRTAIERSKELQMRTHNAFVRFVMGLTASSALAFSGAIAQTVNIEVAADKTIAKRVPDLFGYGANIWWIPHIMEAGLEQRIMDMGHLGMTRISLGDQILTHATSLEDLRARLENYPLNDFVRRYTKAGGRIMFILDGVPIWLSSNKSTKKLPDPNVTVFRISAPSDYEEWSRVVETIVRHFNGKLGLNAYYESWNEPNWEYLGTTEEYHKQYYYSVLGARRADPKALIGGPAYSEFLGVGTRGDPHKTDADKARIAKMILEQNFAFKQFLNYAARTPLPELGLARLPVDFFTWHGFYIDPSSYYQLVVPVFRAALESAGYPRNTPLVHSEWNIAPVPPYPEGDLNANEVGAAYVAANLLAMHEAGVDNQIFQMYLDPGVKGYFGGTFTESGIARANFNTFRLFSRLKGAEVQTRSSDPWVAAAAFQDEKNLYLIVSTLVPTPKMIEHTTHIRNAVANEQFTRSVAKAGATAKRGLPEPLARKAQQLDEQAKQLASDISRKAASRKRGFKLEIELSGLRSASGKVTHYLIDSKHSNIYKDLAKAERHLADRTQQHQKQVTKQMGARLQDAGVPRETVKRLEATTGNEKAAREAMSTLPEPQRKAITGVLTDVAKDVRNQYSETLREIENWPSARLHEESIAWPASGKLTLDSEPYAVHLFVVPR
jgi:hypothetical protein